MDERAAMVRSLEQKNFYNPVQYTEKGILVGVKGSRLERAEDRQRRYLIRKAKKGN